MQVMTEPATETGFWGRGADTLAWRVGAVVFIIVLFALDQWTKHLVLSHEEIFTPWACFDSQVNLSSACGRMSVPGPMDLTMIWNRGISFGAFQAQGIMRWVLFSVSGIIATGFTIWLFRNARKWTSIALALVIAGAIGNMVDRARYGAVVDFIDFSELWPPYFFNYVFNIADAAITVGAILLFVDQYLVSRADKEAEDA